MGYMSPEQAQGKTKEIDHRSDIFSFGCILFEAITGQKAFAGKDQIETLNKIIREPAPPLSALSIQMRLPNCNELFDAVWRKIPDERYQNIKDVAIELKEVRREMQEGTADATVPPVSSASSEARTMWQSETTRVQSAPPATAEPLSSPSTRASSAEFIITGLKQHKTATVIGAVVVVNRRRCRCVWNSILPSRRKHGSRS